VFRFQLGGLGRHRNTSAEVPAELCGGSQLT
jgi:hypothetical protein